MRRHVTGISRRGRKRQGGDEAGMMLIEVVMAAAIMVLVLMAAGAVVTQDMLHRREFMRSYRALVGLEDFLADVQATANLSEDLTAGTGIGSLYQRFHGQTVSIPGIPSGRIMVTCYADEATVPPELGGPQDLNFDGDAEDNLGGQAQGMDMKVIPMRLDLIHGTGNELTSTTVYRLVGKTTD